MKSEPGWDKDSNTKELIWKFGTLAPASRRPSTSTLRPKKDAGEVKNLAYVKFEHGEAVTTRINKPVVKITKTAPKQTVRDEQYVVRIAVDNTGRVPVEKVRIAENVPASAEIQPITAGGVRMAQPQGQQWVWEIAKLMPGERKYIEYRTTAREGKDVFALTNLSAEKGIQTKSESTTRVLVPGLSIKLSGPAANAPVSPGESAKYEITVRNAGTLTSTNVRVIGTLPNDTKPSMKTEGGQIIRDAIQWVIPRLDPGEARTFRFAVKSHSTGRRVVVATVADARGQRAVDELSTLFQGNRRAGVGVGAEPGGARRRQAGDVHDQGGAITVARPAQCPRGSRTAGGGERRAGHAKHPSRRAASCPSPRRRSRPVAKRPTPSPTRRNSPPRPGSRSA